MDLTPNNSPTGRAKATHRLEPRPCPAGRRPRLGAAWVGAQAARSLGRVLKLKRETEEPNEFNLK